MTPRDELVQAMAQSVFNSFYGGSSGLDDMAASIAKGMADAALAAIESHAGGCVVVPRVRTAEMQRAVLYAVDRDGDKPEHDPFFDDGWDAEIAASPYAPET